MSNKFRLLRNKMYLERFKASHVMCSKHDLFNYKEYLIVMLDEVVLGSKVIINAWNPICSFDSESVFEAEQTYREFIKSWVSNKYYEIRSEDVI